MADGDIVRVARIDDRVRDRIAVNGHVWNPGQQGFSAGLTLDQALRRAGGVKPDAYLGRVLVARLNADSTRTQLRVMLRDSTGATMEPFPLQADDEITTFRPDRYVVISGAVQKGGRFAYRDGMTLRDLALLAGGITDFADLRQAEIARRPDTSSTLVLSETVRIPLDSGYLFAEGRVPPAGTRDIALKPYDNVLIFADPERRAPVVVRVTGEVQYPGTYTLRTRNEQLSSLIERAGGITGQGDAGAAHFSRRLASEALVERLVQTTGSDSARLDDGGSRIRVGVDLPRALARSDSRENLYLENGDSLHIPPRQQIVTVRGEVNVPTALVASGQRLGAYIKAGGGPTATANGRRAYVIQPNGKIESRTRLFWLITLDPTPRPGATVVVPAKGERTDSGTSIPQLLALVAQTMATVAAAIAITR
jgi:protein involved in polysaccharide export with SLBB domain